MNFASSQNTPESKTPGFITILVIAAWNGWNVILNTSRANKGSLEPGRRACPQTWIADNLCVWSRSFLHACLFIFFIFWRNKTSKRVDSTAQMILFVNIYALITNVYTCRRCCGRDGLVLHWASPGHLPSSQPCFCFYEIENNSNNILMRRK